MHPLAASENHSSNRYILKLQVPQPCSLVCRNCQSSSPDARSIAHYVSAGVLSLLFVAGFGLSSSIAAAAAEVWVITDRQHSVDITPSARLIELDAPARIKAELSKNLSPIDPEQTSLIVRHRLKSGGAQLQQRFAKAYQDVIDAWSLGVTKAPAVIVDRRYVIYGETNVARAVARIEKYRSTKK
jgi:integrating conjugative element protein (TIGR03757 family)